MIRLAEAAVGSRAASGSSLQAITFASFRCAGRARVFREGIDGFKGGLSAENYIGISKTSRATATRDLQDLVEKDALTKTGELRRTRYFLSLRASMMRL